MKLRILLGLIVVGILVFILSLNKEPEKQFFVENRTIEINENFLFREEIIEYPSNGEIIPEDIFQKNLSIGITADPWNLNFGRIPRGSATMRYLNLTNSHGKEYKIKLRAYGNTSQFVDFSKNDFMIGSGKTEKIKITFNTTGPTKIGNYAGEIDVIIMVPNNIIAEKFLWLS